MQSTQIERWLSPEAKLRRKRLRRVWVEEALSGLWEGGMKPEEKAAYRSIAARLYRRVDGLHG